MGMAMLPSIYWENINGRSINLFGKCYTTYKIAKMRCRKLIPRLLLPYRAIGRKITSRVGCSELVVMRLSKLFVVVASWLLKHQGNASALIA